jgi:glutaminyl-tRNA synthetase
MALLEHCVRVDLNKRARRVMAVLRPLKVILINYPEGQAEELEAINNPEDIDMGTRKIFFSRTIYIEQEDFNENPPKKFYRLAPGREVRLRYAFFIKCVDVIKDEETGDIVELHCTYDSTTKGGSAPDGRKVKATLHWVSAEHSMDADINLYDNLFIKENPEEGKEGSDFRDYLNPDSLITLKSCKVEPELKAAKAGEYYQFERQGYFCLDADDSTDIRPIFNRTVSLRDTWARIQKAGQNQT